MKTLATLYTGGDGFGIGGKAAGLEPLWGVEINPAIADWAERNSPGLTIIRASVTDVDYTTLEQPYWLHMSPVCKNASVAKQGGEAEGDLEMAQGCIMAIEALQPPVVSLENVYPYREFQSFKNILACLHRNGYAFDYWYLNAADYGVPQTRQRLILIARKDHKPLRPEATHCEGGEPATMFGPGLLPWVGWYKAIEDLIPGLPESRFAKWQLERLPAEFNNTFSIGADDGSTKNQRAFNEPANTVTPQFGGRSRAFILGNGQRSAVNGADLPVDTITSNSNQTGVRAWIVPGENASNDFRTYIKNGEQPTNTVASVKRAGNMPRALPQGRVVAMTPRALARFQSFPDSYQLPDKKGLACEIIGNAVPPLLARRVVEAARD